MGKYLTVRAKITTLLDNTIIPKMKLNDMCISYEKAIDEISLQLSANRKVVKEIIDMYVRTEVFEKSGDDLNISYERLKIDENTQKDINNVFGPSFFPREGSGGI